MEHGFLQRIAVVKKAVRGIRKLGSQGLFCPAGDGRPFLGCNGAAQGRSIGGGSRENLAADHIGHGHGLNVQQLAIALQVNFIPGPELGLCKDAMTGDQVDVLLQQARPVARR